MLWVMQVNGQVSTEPEFRGYLLVHMSRLRLTQQFICRANMAV